MSSVVVATVDEIHGEVIAEALAGAGVTATLRPVGVGYVHQPLYRLQTYADMRPLLDVEVAAGDADAARGIIQGLEATAQRDLDAQALEGTPPADAEASGPALIARSRALGRAAFGAWFVLSLLLPLSLLLLLW